MTPRPAPPLETAARPPRRLARLAGAAAALALLAVLLTFARPAELATTLRQARLAPLLAALAATASIVVLEAYRLRCAFAPEIARLAGSIRLTLESALFAQLTPGMVGGEGYRLLWLRRRGAGVVRVVAILAFLRLVGLAAVSLLALAGLPLLARAAEAGWWRRAVPAAAVVAAALAVVGLALLARRRRAGRGGSGGGALRRALRQALGQAADGLRQVGLAAATRIGVASLAVGLARAAVVLLLLAALGERLGPGPAVAASALATLGSVVPLLPGGLGMQEGALALALTAAGASMPAAVSAALLQRSLQWATALVGGLVLLAGRRHGAVADGEGAG